MKRYCFYHNDTDGSCAAAIVLKYFNGDVECLPVNYNNIFPFEIVNSDDEIYIVDYSLQKENEWEKLFSITKNVIWIDHHKTAIEAINEKGFSFIKGIRDVSYSGCVLTWKFLYPEVEIPKVVSLIGDQDIWKFEFPQTKSFNQGLYSLIDTTPDSDFWDKMLVIDTKETMKAIDDLCDVGTKILEKQKKSNANLLQSWGFEVEFEEYKCIAINKNGINSTFFDSIAHNYDILMPFIFDGEQYTISLYGSGTENSKKIDLSLLAKKFGGGGHPQASGFQCKKLPFKIIKRLGDK